MREAVYADLLPGERAPVHAAVAAAIGDAGAQAELAVHWRAAGDAPRALRASVAAGLEAEEARAFDEALRHLRAALELWDADEILGLDRIELLGHLSDLARHTGEHAQAVAWCEQALAVLDGTEDAARAARFFERLGRLQAFEDDSGLAAYREALRLLPHGDRAGPRAAARRRGVRAVGAAPLRRGARARPRRRSRSPRRRGAAGEAAYARTVLGLVVALRRATRGRAPRTCARRSRELEGLGRPEDLLYAHLYLAESLRLLGDFEGALAVTLEGERHARRLGMQASFGRFLALNAATDEFLLGRWEDAEARLAELDDRDLEPWNAIARGQVAGQLHLARGELEEAERELREAEALCEGAPAEYVPAVYAGLAELELWQGRPGAARELVGQRPGGRCAASSELLYAPSLFAMGARVEAEAALAAAAEPAGASAPPRAAGRLRRRARDARGPGGRARRRRSRTGGGARRGRAGRGRGLREALWTRGRRAPGRRSARPIRRPTRAGAARRRRCATRARAPAPTRCAPRTRRRRRSAPG